jgi:tetratricopeptide (TPR) repeat protein
VRVEAHDKAKRLARLIVSEIGLYNPWWNPKGRRGRFVVSRSAGSRAEALEHLIWEIEQGRQYYNERVPSDVRASGDYYQEAVVSTLAGGDPKTLEQVDRAVKKSRRAGWRTTATCPATTSLFHTDEPVDLETRYCLGIAYRDMGLLEEAITEFELAAVDDTLLFAAASMLGLCHLDQGEPKKAVEWLERGLHVPGRAKEEYHALRYDLARALEASGELESALALFSELCEHEGRPAEPHVPRREAESVAGRQQGYWQALLPDWIRKVEEAFQRLEEVLAVSERKEILDTLQRSREVLGGNRRDDFRVCVLRLQRAQRLLEAASRRR